MTVFTIGHLADAAGVNVETIRYYERRGILDEPPRSASGYRQYGDADLWRLDFIRRAKALGFTLTEIASLLEAQPRDQREGSVERVLATEVLDTPKRGAVTVLTAGTFDEFVASVALPVLVDFTATWCPPCRQLSPVLHPGPPAGRRGCCGAGGSAWAGSTARRSGTSSPEHLRSGAVGGTVRHASFSDRPEAPDVSRLEDVAAADGWRCWLCDEPVDPEMSVNDPRGPSIDSVTTKAKSKRKGGDATERLAHRACNTRKGAVAPVVPWPEHLFVAEPAPIVNSVERLQRKGGREIMARCPTQADGDEAAAWLLDRLTRLSPGAEFTAEVEPGGGQFLVVLRA